MTFEAFYGDFLIPGPRVKVLSAILESYQVFLKETYTNVSDDTVELLAKARDLVGKDIAKAEEEYRKFREDRAPTPDLDKAISAERLHALERRKTELLIQ